MSLSLLYQILTESFWYMPLFILRSYCNPLEVYALMKRVASCAACCAKWTARLCPCPGSSDTDLCSRGPLRFQIITVTESQCLPSTWSFLCNLKWFFSLKSMILIKYDSSLLRFFSRAHRQPHAERYCFINLKDLVINLAAKVYSTSPGFVHKRSAWPQWSLVPANAPWI